MNKPFGINGKMKNVNYWCVRIFSNLFIDSLISLDAACAQSFLFVALLSIEMYNKIIDQKLFKMKKKCKVQKITKSVIHHIHERKIEKLCLLVVPKQLSIVILGDACDHFKMTECTHPKSNWKQNTNNLLLHTQYGVHFRKLNVKTWAL